MFAWTTVTIGAFAVLTLLSEVGLLAFLALGAPPAPEDEPEGADPAEPDAFEREEACAA